jgi:HEAT repeat protein
MIKLDRLEADRNFPGLIAALEGDVRGDAALALGRLGEPRAIPYLVELLRDDPEPNVRLFAVYALGQLRAKDAEGVLVEALNDSAPIVRMGAAETLGAIRARGAMPQLRNALDSDPDKYVRLSAVESLVLLGDVEARARVPEVLQEIPWRVRGSSRYKRFRRAVEAVEAGEPLTSWRE